MKNKLFTLAAALMLAAVLGGVYAAPALAAAMKAVLVKNIDEPGRVPYQASVNDAIACPTVLDGKRFVVEYIGGTVVTGSGTLVELRFTLGATRFPLPLRNQGTSQTLTYFNFGGPIKGYLDSGEVCNMQSGGAQPTSFSTVVSGYMVDLTN
jgi:hypothetical protein